LAPSKRKPKPTPTTPPADGTYRGRRRLPKLPSPRYFRVVATAFAAAALVALGSSVIVPDRQAEARTSDVVLDRLSAANEEKRADLLRGSAEIVIDPDAPDLWVLPLKSAYTISTYYEWRAGQPGVREGWHYGVDMAAAYGSPIYATHDGTVLVAGWVGDYGYCTMIDHGNGIITVYGHSSALYTTPGQRVQMGQQIAAVGSTGESSGNHLHYEVRLAVGGRGPHGEVDPVAFMKERGVDIVKHRDEAGGGVI